jgi:hypothetical protein
MNFNMVFNSSRKAFGHHAIEDNTSVSVTNPVPTLAWRHNLIDGFTSFGVLFGEKV